MHLKRGTVLGESGSTVDFVYFVEAGTISTTAQDIGGNGLELCSMGPEGLAPVPALLSRRPLLFHYLVQLPAVAHRIPIESLRGEIARSDVLRTFVLEAADWHTNQLGQSALCSRYHTPPQRLARWLLLTASQHGSERLSLTHDVLARMIAAPRSTVTETLGELRSIGAISYRRGSIDVVDPRRLRPRACQCFDVLRSVLDEYRHEIERL